MHTNRKFFLELSVSELFVKTMTRKFAKKGGLRILNKPLILLSRAIFKCVHNYNLLMSMMIMYDSLEMTVSFHVLLSDVLVKLL